MVRLKKIYNFALDYFLIGQVVFVLKRSSYFLLSILPYNNKEFHSNSEDQTRPDIVEEIKNASEESLPIKSKKVYDAAYNRLMTWTRTKGTKSLSENVLMTYFCEMAQTMKPSTLWTHYSMLKRTLRSKNDIKIKNYAKLLSFLKEQSTGFKSKKPKILSSHDIETFLNKAPDYRYLATKVNTLNMNIYLLTIFV